MNAMKKRMSIHSISKASAQTALQNNQIDRQELQWDETEDNVIGTGATARVFKGVWHGKQVAVKQLNLTKRWATQLRQEVAFLREATIIAQISHQGLVQFYGVAIDRQPYLLITEFCAGGTCYNLLHIDQDIDLEVNQQLKMCCDIACAMDYLHKFQPQIIHRDLKSLNLLLVEPVTSTDDVPYVKVADFGLGKMKDHLEDWGHMTKEVGTAAWRAPETSTGTYTEKADIYSFAMCVFEIICEEIPFHEMDSSEVTKAVYKGARPDMEAVPPFMPPDLVTLMVQCWAHEPSNRPSFHSICIDLHTISRDLS